MNTKEMMALFNAIETVAKLVNKYYDTLVNEGMDEALAFELALELQTSLIFGGVYGKS